MQTEGVDIRSVGNTAVSLLHSYCVKDVNLCNCMKVLQETALVETFNLKAAIEFQLKNCMFK